MISNRIARSLAAAVPWRAEAHPGTHSSRLGQYGALALALLVAGGVSASLAGSVETEEARRWIVGSRVNLRDYPAPDAGVLDRLALNTEVRLLAALSDGKFCEIAVRPSDAPEMHGYVACQYLGEEPVSARKLHAHLDTGLPNPEFDPQRAFWREPSHAALTAYGQHLEATVLGQSRYDDRAAPRPRDSEFERMKAHLAKGIYGPLPTPYPVWDDFRRQAAAWRHERREIVRAKLRKYGTDPSEELQTVTNRHAGLRDTLGLFQLDAAQALGLVGSIELPAAKSSLFRDMNELAAPGESTEQVSGRFRIVHTLTTRGRDPQRGEEGVWDIGSVSLALTRPVVRHTLFRDGSLAAASSHLRHSVVEWSDIDGPMCEDFVPGYAYGDSDPKIWTGDDLDQGGHRLSLARRPKDSLFWFHVRSALPMQKAAVSQTQQILDREATGFVAATTFHYDLDGDGVADLAVWEGTGQAPGHLDGPRQTDEAWQRLIFANIAGRWRLLGQDSFSYGCGC